MTTIIVALSEPMHDWVESRVEAGHHGDAADYVRALIQRDQDRAGAIAEVQMHLDEGFASGVSDRSMSEVLEDARAQVRAKFVA